MDTHLLEFAKKCLHLGYDSLSEREQKVVQHFVERLHISRNVNRDFEGRLSFGQRLADRVASFGGSWTFIIIFAAVLLSWVVLNSFILARRGGSFDPYPYILLNLFLSMLAAIQAPIIMMSQNRQAAKDRLDAAHDYEVNLKAELEILSLHAKIDELRERKWAELIIMQQEQIGLLTQLLKDKGSRHRQQSSQWHMSADFSTRSDSFYDYYNTSRYAGRHSSPRRIDAGVLCRVRLFARRAVGGCQFLCTPA